MGKEELKMVFKLRKLLLGLIFVACFSIPASWSAEMTVPAPVNAVKVSERNVNIGPLKAYEEVYETSLDQKKVAAFYKKELQLAGWKQKNNVVFMKDRSMVLLTFFKQVKKGAKLRFSVLVSQGPTEKEAIATRKSKPDKLDFMPTYPGCEQLFLWETNTGYVANYETKSSAKEVVFFYKSGMLNYGWSLVSEMPLSSKTIDCPECKKVIKSPINGIKPNFSGVLTKATLMFKRGEKETCSLVISSLAMDNATEDSMVVPSTTKIIAQYYVYKGIH